MDIKEVNKQAQQFVPHNDFHDFFDSWKKEQERIGMNWSVKSIDRFKEAMFTGMIFLNTVNENSQETVQQETTEVKKETPVEQPRQRARAESKESAPEENKRVRNRVANSEPSTTINNTGSRIRTRTKNSN
ncbi:MAG: hypothetical protein HRU18_01400 [Pseudoalteromonas sp.]|uniref:hypothetical protein n=1 Tax=Pseudoalteromonas sp. TaxID=53249 RepID=UPI001E1929F6|nr:hypothetical protein [Pseudoalteromonas sp.]NRA76836.1 hypothetical protein [Pseudoalteromonas sp.]